MKKPGSRGAFGISLLALSVGVYSKPVMAQQNSTTDQIPPSNNSAESAIVVTATKRNVKLTDAPVSVVVYDTLKIAAAGITVPSDFLQQTSNVNFTTSISPGDFLISIRGQSSIRGAEPSVAIIIDGAKVGTPAEFNTALFDLEQIEVLKGPQGAYYGRNATAGVIALTSKKPTEDFSGSAKFSYGNNNAYNATASFSGAVVPGAVLARLSMSFKGSDGSYTNEVTGEKSQRYKEESARLRLTYDTGGPLTADFRVTGISGEGGAFYFTPKVQTVPGLSPGGTFVNGVHVTDISANKNLDVPYVSDVAGLYRRKIVSSALKLDYDMGAATITSISGLSYGIETQSGKNYPYANPSDSGTQYFGWTPLFGDKTQLLQSKTTQIQQEIRLTSKGSRFIDYQAGFEFTYNNRDYLTANYLNGALPQNLIDNPGLLANYGGYTANSDGSFTRTLIGGGNPVAWPPVIQGLNSPYPSTNYFIDRYTAYNYAPYANVKINFTHALSLQLAARYDVETRHIGAIGPDVASPFFGGGSFNPCVRITGQTAEQCRVGNNATYRQLQPKAILNYKLGGTGTVYASWGKSFKSGGFNSIGTREISIESKAAQYIALGQSPAAARALAEKTVITQDFYNKEVATTYEAGAKAELFNRRLYVNAAVFWTEINNGQLYVFDPVAFVQSIQSIDKERVKGFELEATLHVAKPLSLFGSFGYIDPKIRQIAAQPSAVGNRPPYVALSTLTVGEQFTQEIDATKKLNVRVEYNRTGPTYYSIDNDPDFRRGPFSVVNARLGINTARWSATLYARNLFNTRYVNEIAPISTGAATALSLAELRTFGVELKTNF